MNRLSIDHACERLLFIERTQEILKCRDGQYHLWPMIRLPLWFVMASKPRSFFKNIYKLFAYMLRVLLSLVNSKRTFNLGASGAVLLLADNLYYTEKSNGHAYHRIMDPVLDAISNIYPVQKLNVFKQHHGSYARDGFEIPIGRTNFISHWKAIRATCRHINILKSISYTAEVSFLSVVNGFLRHYSRALYSSLFYERLFIKNPPKIVFIACWYRQENMGVCHAAKKLNITCVDLQHGKQGKYNGAYNHWSVLPPGGFDSIPSVFWLWNQESEENIHFNSHSQWAKETRVIGNLWLERFLADENLGKNIDIFTPRLKKRKIILISLQSDNVVLDGAFPDFLIDAIEESPDDWLWFFRLHPNHLHLRFDVEKKLLKVNKNKYYLCAENQLSLYSVLKKAFHHISAFSSVVYEAEAFGVKSSLFGEDALMLFSKQIKEGRFFHFKNADELLEQIGSNTKHTGNNKHCYRQNVKSNFLRELKYLFEHAHSD